MSDAVHDTCTELPVREVMESVKLGVPPVKLGVMLGWLKVGTSKDAMRAPSPTPGIGRPKRPV
jgi:hypothetical protein